MEEIKQTEKEKLLLHTKTEAILKQHVFISMGVGLIPIPILDIAAVTIVQLDLIRDLSLLYRVDYSARSGKTFLTAIGGSVGARLGASMIKIIPGVSTILGGISMSIMSGAATYAIGALAIESFKQGESIDNWQKEDIANKYDEFFELGKEAIKNWKKESYENQSPEKLIMQLKEIAALKEKGAITEEEYKQMKVVLLKQFPGQT